MTETSDIMLCDLGGTHARFARYAAHGRYELFKKYRLDHFETFEDIISAYMSDTAMEFSYARFSAARAPVNGVIDYKRFAGDPIERIDFNHCEKLFGWTKDRVRYFNDLEAGAYGLLALDPTQIDILIPPHDDPWNDNRLLVSVGTGVGHALATHDGRIFQTTGGHFLPVTVTEEHRAIERFIRARKDKDLSLIMEDFVSGRGLVMITEHVSGQSLEGIDPADFIKNLPSHPDAIRLFFEFLGLYAHTLAGVTGFYGGIYLTGGVIDNLIRADLTDWASFNRFFKPPMVSSVNARLNSTGVYYILHEELPLLGLTMV